MITVRLNGQARQVAPGQTVGALVAAAADDGPEFVAAAIDNHLVSLDAVVDGDATLRPIRGTEPAGQEVVRRACSHLLLAAANHVLPGLRLVVGQSLLGGHFYEVRPPDGDPIDLDELAAALTREVEGLVEADLPFRRLAVPLEAATAQLTDPGGTKRRLLRAWSSPMVPMIRLDGFVDVQHGPYPPSSRFARGARVVPYAPGVVLQFPDAEPPQADGARQLWFCYCETRDANRRVGVATVGDLNEAILADRLNEVQRVAEALHEKRIAKLADAIAARRDAVRIVTVAGPSSAGKTTFVRRLSVQLRVNGVDPVVIGLDDYYRDRRDCPVDADGEVDLEALEALDLALLHDHLQRFLAGEEVRVPTFDFVRQRPVDPELWRPVRLGPHQVLLLEGIHGLNPRLVGGIPAEARFRIYINALTQLVIDEHNRIRTTDGRLLRRIVRDRRYRGTPAAETIARWPSVRRGEERHIYPYQEECDAMFNSALVYEAAVLRTFAHRYLLEVPPDHPSRLEAYRLLKFIGLFVPVFPDGVPANSVLREFIGGSGFSY